jgi:hypothetical protein
LSVDARTGRFSRRTILLAGAAVIVVLGLAIGLPLGLSSSGSHHATTTTAAATGGLSHASYARLYHEATLGQTTTAVLKQWPNPPYQRYHSGSGLVCYEWWDKPVALYNLCFDKKGVLEDKAIE